jgi:SSS family transporter
MLLLFIGLYLLSNLFIGWWASSRVKTTQDFAIAGRRLPLSFATAAMFATWFGSETVLGASSEFLEKGLLGVIEDPFGSSLCLILVGLFFTRKLYRLNLLTFNDYFRMRYSRQAELVSAIFMIPSYFGWVAAQLVALGIILQVIAGIPLYWGILLCSLVVVIYTYTGGMWAVSITDFVQTIVIIVGLFFLSYEMIYQVGGLEKLYQQTPPQQLRFFPDFNFSAISVYVAAWITVGLGSIPQQDVFQRVMSSKSEKVAVRAAYLSGLMYLSIAMMPLLIAMCGKILYPELLKGDIQMLLPQVVLKHTGLFMQVMFFGALMSAILSTTSGAMLAPAVVIGENIIRPYYKNLSDAKMLTIMRLSVVGVAFCSTLMAILERNIYELVSQSSALSLVSLFMPLAAGLYWKRASNVGALASIIGGMATWGFCEFMAFDYPSILPGFGVSILGMVIGSLLVPHKLEKEAAVEFSFKN